MQTIEPQMLVQRLINVIHLLASKKMLTRRQINMQFQADTLELTFDLAGHVVRSTISADLLGRLNDDDFFKAVVQALGLGPKWEFINGLDTDFFGWEAEQRATQAANRPKLTIVNTDATS